MLIKVIKNGEISEWREHNQEIHKQMLRDKPEYVVINIKDFYSDSQDSARTEIISFDVFDYIYRQTRLEEKAQEKSDKRHLIYNHDFDNDKDDFDFVEEFVSREEYKLLKEALHEISNIQRRRILMRYLDELSVKEISDMENSSRQCIERSIKNALKNLCKLLKIADD